MVKHWIYLKAIDFLSQIGMASLFKENPDRPNSARSQVFAKLINGVHTEFAVLVYRWALFNVLSHLLWLWRKFASFSFSLNHFIYIVSICDIDSLSFSNRIFVTVSQCGKIGNLFSVHQESSQDKGTSSAKALTIFTIK